jgi:DNA-binding IclR family transcriptional regulator
VYESEGVMHTNGEQLRDGDIIRRTITVLKAIDSYHGGWFRLSDIARKAQLPASTTHRYLTILKELAIIEQHELQPSPQYLRYRKAKP